MFDVGFWELVLVGTVALVVFGPERLPRVAREAGLWIRKARSMVASVKSEIDQELQLQELRQTLQEEKRKLSEQTTAYQGLLKSSLEVNPDKPEANGEREERGRIDE